MTHESRKLPDHEALVLQLGDSVNAIYEEVDRIQNLLQSLKDSDGDIQGLKEAIAKSLFAPSVKFANRLLEHKTEKLFLGRIAATLLKNASTTRYFIESGTTGTWLSYVLKSEFVNRPKHFIVTNNKAVADVMCSSDDVYQTEGKVELTYSGIFPFNLNRGSTDTTKSDTVAFERLFALMQGFDLQTLLLNASRFDFLIGPTIGSWQNALFKAAVFNVNRPIQVWIPFAKLIQDLGSPKDVGENGDEHPDTVYWHISHCYTAFDLPLISHSLFPDPKIARANSAFEDIRPLISRLRLTNTWYELAQSRTSHPDRIVNPLERLLSVWVACKPGNEEKSLVTHLERINRILSEVSADYRWKSHTHKAKKLLGVECFPIAANRI